MRISENKNIIYEGNVISENIQEWGTTSLALMQEKRILHSVMACVRSFFPSH